MSFSEYGPFAGIIAIAAALVAVFSMLALKAVGRVANWTWLLHDSPPFMVTAGARALAIALIALCYLGINKENYFFFACGALLFAVAIALLVGRFNTLRSIHVYKCPKVGANGSQVTDADGKPIFDSVLIGEESAMRPEARKAWRTALRIHNGLSLTDFMAGYGAREVNNAEAIWDRKHLAKVNNSMTMTLMGIVLCGVMTLYLAALSIEIHQRPVDGTKAGVLSQKTTTP